MSDLFEKILIRGSVYRRYPSVLWSRKKVSNAFVSQLDVIKRKLKIEARTLLDVGAAVGEWSLAARTVFPSAKIHAFEPIPDSIEKLKALNPSDPSLTIHGIALGDKEQISVFHLNDFSFSSSLLPMTHRHKELFPFTKSEKEIHVQCKRFDQLPDLKIDRPCLLKLDVQGYELHALRGFGKRLGEVDAVWLEVCFEPFYEGQPGFDDVFGFMKDSGFNRFLQLSSEFVENKLAYCDLVFVRDPK